jgi:hypothetical protein
MWPLVGFFAFGQITPFGAHQVDLFASSQHVLMEINLENIN